MQSEPELSPEYLVYRASGSPHPHTSPDGIRTFYGVFRNAPIDKPDRDFFRLPGFFKDTPLIVF